VSPRSGSSSRRGRRERGTGARAPAKTKAKTTTRTTVDEKAETTETAEAAPADTEQAATEDVVSHTQDAVSGGDDKAAAVPQADAETDGEAEPEAAQFPEVDPDAAKTAEDDADDADDADATPAATEEAEPAAEQAATQAEPEADAAPAEPGPEAEPAEPEPEPEPEPVPAAAAPDADVAAAPAADDQDDFEDDASSWVRPYVWTGGRTETSLDFAVETLVSARQQVAGADETMRDEHKRVLDLCEAPRSVSEIAALLSVPLGVVKTLLGTMVEDDLVVVHRTSGSAAGPDLALMERVLRGLKNL